MKAEHPDDALKINAPHREGDRIAAVGEAMEMMLAGAQDYAFFLMTAEGLISTWNLGARNLFGFESGEIVGRPFSTLFTEEDRRAGIPARELEEAARHGAANDDRWHLRQDGTRFWANGLTTAIKTGHVLAYAKMVRDTTPQKLAERKLNELSLQLQEQARALTEASEQKDRFLASLSHELRNYLSPVLGAAEFLTHRVGSDSDALLACEIQQKQIHAMTRLVNDLLDSSRIITGKLRLQQRWIDLRDCVRNAADTAGVLIQERQQLLEICLPEEAVEVEVDPSRIEQILINLLNNAAKYTPRQGSIRLTLQCYEDHVRLSVKDTGDGLAAEDLPKLFNLFSQVRHSERRSQGGLGIGLSLVKGLAESHGGSVTVKSDGMGRGSEFVVLLPR